MPLETGSFLDALKIAIRETNWSYKPEVLAQSVDGNRRFVRQATNDGLLLILQVALTDDGKKEFTPAVTISS